MFQNPTPNELPDESIPFIPFRFSFEKEKQFMNPIRFRTNYIFVPAYVILCAVCLVTGVVFMALDENRYLPVFLIALGIMAAASVALLYQAPKTRKQEIAIELERYDLDTEHFPGMESYPVQNELWDVQLTEIGMVVNGKHYYYSALSPSVVTSNRFNRVWIAIRFGTDRIASVYAPLNGSIIRAVEEFGIPLDNREKLEFLRKNKENVFAQIYNSGDFRVFD